MYSFLRVLRFAFQDIVRNISLSLMTVFMLTLMLLSINVLFMLHIITNQATALIKDRVDISIFFTPKATDGQIKEVQDYIQLFSEVTQATLIPKEQVLADFREAHKDNPDIISSLDELTENPLGATMIIKTNTPGIYQKIIESLQVPEYKDIIEAKTFGDTEVAIGRIETITSQVERFSLGLSVLFGIIAFFIIFNTIRVAIFTHRIEIIIKKLVGATNWFVRGPYIIEAIIFSLLSLGITAGIMYSALRTIDPYVEVVFEQANVLTNYFSSNILMLLALQGGGVLLLTALSSMLAMRKHLRA